MPARRRATQSTNSSGTSPTRTCPRAPAGYARPSSTSTSATPSRPPGRSKQLTARELLDGERAAAWLADAAEGKTRTRNTLRGPDAAAYPNSMRVRADTVNAFAEFLGEPARVDRQAPARGYHLTPGDTERLLHDLTVKRPIHANAMTALRTAAVAAVIADTGHGVPEIADLKLSALHLDGDVAGGQEASVELDGESFPLTRSTVHVLTRWLAARGSLIAELEGSDPGYLWIPTKPGRPRGGVPSAKPGINPAAVRTLHASHRALVSQLLGTPLRPGALRAAAVSLSVSTADQELCLPSGPGRPRRRLQESRRRCGTPASRPRSGAWPRHRCRPN